MKARAITWPAFALAAASAIAAACDDLTPSLVTKNHCSGQADCVERYGCLEGTCQPWVDAPGVIGAEAFSGSKSFLVNVLTSGTYYVALSYKAVAAGTIDVTFGHDGDSQLCGDVPDAGVPVQHYLSASFNGVLVGPYIVTVSASDGVTITEVSVTTKPNPS